MSVYRNSGRARTLRAAASPAERRLWTGLRRRAVSGCKFRRQAPIGGMIVDFACFDPPLVVEVDGGYHDLTWETDRRRDAILKRLGFTVLRFTNAEVLENGDGVLCAIRMEVDKLLTQRKKKE